MSTEQHQFSKIRAIIFPIFAFELKKVIPMGLIFFFILFNYTCLRNVKDVLVVTSAGAETLTFLKTFCVTPAAIVFLIVYTKASDILTNEKLFYWTLTPFIIFFGLFALFMYPNKELLHPSEESILALQEAYPRLQYFIKMYGYWSYSLFYILAELWGSAILSLSFWQFANQISKTTEAKRFYAFFSFVGQLAMLAAGYLGIYFSDIRDKVAPGVDAWGVSLNWLMGMVVFGGIATMVLYRWIYKYILTDKRFYNKPHLPGVVSGESEGSGGKKKKKPSLGASFKVIFTSPYLGLIAVLVISYGASVNLIEGLWKSQLKLRYPDPNDYSVFMSQFTAYTGYATMCMLVIGSNILRLFRWATAAVVTPVIFLLGGTLFFSFILFSDKLQATIDNWGTNPLVLAVMMGAGIVVVVKATKYALFDLTKEMSYIPLSEEMKVKGKAAVDVVGGRLGKTGGAGFQAFLMTVVYAGASYIRIAPIVAATFLIVVIIWIVAVKKLGPRVEAARKAQHDEA